MQGSWVLTPAYYLALGFLAGVVGFRLGWRTGRMVALPILQGLLGWAAFLLAWSELGPAWAAGAVAAWAVGTTAVSTTAFVGDPRRVDQVVFRAATYRATMLDWLRSGRGPESRPGATARQHLRELIYYVAAAVLTANLASLAMGAVLLNYMNAYVATLLRAATRTGVVALLAWNIWSIVRVAGYVVLGAAAASPLLAMGGMTRDPATVRLLAIAGAAGAVLDLGLKLVLSRSCGRALAASVDLVAASENRSSERPLKLGLS